jgi:hypothetical protein
MLSSALTTKQDFVSNPESKQAATAIEQRQGSADRGDHEGPRRQGRPARPVGRRQLARPGRPAR